MCQMQLLIKTTRMHCPCFLSSLPQSVLVRIVTRLDCHSVRGLLLAFECLHPLSVVVKDEQESGPVFFDIPGVKQATFQDVLDSSNDGVAFLFKLVEANLANKRTRDFLFQRSFQCLDSLSFVYYYEGLPHMYCYPEHDPLAVLGIHDSKYSLSFASALFQPHVNPVTIIQLCLSETLYVEDLDLPYLLRLSIHFYKDPHNASIPVIRNLTVPVLRSFTVHYSGRLPLIYNIDCSQDKRLPQSQGDFSSVFELCNNNGMDLKKHIISTDTFQYSSYRRMNLSFAKIFTIHQYIGVPDYILTITHLLTCRSLHWIRTIQYTDESSPPLSPESEITLPRTLNLLFQTSIPNSQIPLFKCPKILTLSLFVTAPNFSLGKRLSFKFGSTLPFSTLCSLNITCHLPTSTLGETGHIILRKPDIRTIFSLQHLKYLTLRGCVFGHDNKFLYEDRIISRLPKQSEQPRLQKIILELVKLHGQGSHLFMNMLNGLYKPSLQLLKLSQETRGTERWDSINVITEPRHTVDTDRMKDLVVEIDDSFKTSNLNDHTADLEDDMWIKTWVRPVWTSKYNGS